MKGTFLGFDFGTKRLGIAVGQSITQTARPLITLQVNNGIPRMHELERIVNEWLPLGLIVGLAMQPDGSHSPTSQKALKLGMRLQAHFRIPVYYIEERLTSVAAHNFIREQPNRSSIGRDKDAVAAAIILESWLANNLKEMIDAPI